MKKTRRNFICYLILMNMMWMICCVAGCSAIGTSTLLLVEDLLSLLPNKTQYDTWLFWRSSLARRTWKLGSNFTTWIAKKELSIWTRSQLENYANKLQDSHFVWQVTTWTEISISNFVSATIKGSWKIFYCHLKWWRYRHWKLKMIRS